MFNIQKAVGRLDFAPKQKEIEITDIKKGLGVFTPLPDKTVSFAAIKDNLKKAGYTLASADITVIGKIAHDGDKWTLTSAISDQKFVLKSKTPEILSSTPDSNVQVTGGWTTVGQGASAQETIDVQNITNPLSPAVSIAGRFFFPPVQFINVSFSSSVASDEPSTNEAESTKRAPIRTTSPGLTVFQGGAFTPRVYLIKQHLGNVKVNRQLLNLSLSYTPTTKVQLEVEVPVSRTSFDDGRSTGSGVGLGNITLWVKYRFFRKVKTWGDRQTSARFGLELPTGSTSIPTAAQVNAPKFVRQQLGSISGGLSPHFDVTFSQAGGRFIFGGNIEGIIRTERNGFRMGHEIRANTDFEYVLLPREYKKPGHELFLIFETNYIANGRGRLNGITVQGSTSSAYYVSPGLQYTLRPNFVIEGSVQLPVIRNTGSLVLKTNYNLLLGVKYLF
ncbi:MAG TPA: transporter [Pyrinomonadaceae bacterium]|nr:transporter [Pyrinomonadaceae bacterium]